MNHRFIWVTERYNPQTMAMIKERWVQLRRTKFTPDSLYNHFEKYFDLFERTGVGEREKQRWETGARAPIDFEHEKEYLRQWIAGRLLYCDKRFGYDSKSDAIHRVGGIDETVQIWSESGGLCGRADKRVDIMVCSIDGSMRHTLHIEPGRIATLRLPKGIYIANAKRLYVW